MNEEIQARMNATKNAEEQHKLSLLTSLKAILWSASELESEYHQGSVRTKRLRDDVIDPLRAVIKELQR